MAEGTKDKTICGVNALWFMPPHVAIISIIVSLALDTLWPTSPAWSFKSPLLGFILIGLGGALIIWTLALFCKWETTPSPMGKTSSLVIEGPFRITRNPIYLGGVVMFAGGALVWGTFAALFAPLSFFLMMNFVTIPHEERHLSELFGESYAAYKKRVRRWV